jgi:hypothetical protein
MREPVTSSSSPWLLSRSADLALFGGSTLAALALLGVGGAAGLLDGDAPPWLWLLCVVGIDVAHVWATGWRVYSDGAELRARSGLYLGLPAAAYALGVVAYSVSALAFWRLLAYAAVFHFVRQQYGWVSLYRRKNGENDEAHGRAERLLDSATIYGATLAPLAWWHSHQPRKFHWLIAGDFVAGLPPAFGTAALFGLAALLAAYAAKEAVRARRGRPISWGKNLVVASTVVTWYVGIVAFDSDYAFTVMNVIVHGVPYFGLVWITSRARAETRAALAQPPTFSDRATRSVALFLLPLFAFAFLEEWGWDRLVWHENGTFFPGPALTPGPALLAFLVPFLALPQATHYLLDGFIWKVRPENAVAVRALGLPEGPHGLADTARA